VPVPRPGIVPQAGQTKSSKVTRRPRICVPLLSGARGALSGDVRWARALVRCGPLSDSKPGKLQSVNSKGFSTFGVTSRVPDFVMRAGRGINDAICNTSVKGYGLAGRD